MEIISIKNVFSQRATHHVCIFVIDGSIQPTRKQTLKKCSTYKEALDFASNVAFQRKLLFLKSPQYKDEFGHFVPIPFVNILIDPVFFV